MSGVDEEAKKQFLELQSKMIETTKQASLMKAHMDANLREIKRTELTVKELEGMGDVKCYQSVGRMFLASDTKALKNELINKAEDLKQETIDLGKSRDRFQRNLKESEQALRELISTRKVMG